MSTLPGATAPAVELRLPIIVESLDRSHNPSAVAGLPPTTRIRCAVALVLALVTVAAAACSGGTRGVSTTGIPDPPHTVAAVPDYTQACSPSGLDSSLTCIQVTLAAVDRARGEEGLRPMLLPSDFPRLSVPEQLLVVVDRERVDRGLTPFEGLSPSLDSDARRGANAAGLPPDVGKSYRHAASEWLGGAVNGLDADYAWMYDDGPGSSAPGCTRNGGEGCWADRHVLLDRYPGHTLVMGAAVDPTGDTTAGDRGGPSLAMVLAESTEPASHLAYTWADALQATRAGTITPRSGAPGARSASGIPDPPSNVAPNPDYTAVCSPSGLDSSAGCLQSVLDAIDSARSREGVKPMVLPLDFAQLSIPEQIFVVVDRERVDRGLPPFLGLTSALDRNAEQGAAAANDPPDPGASYLVADTEWAGGSSNGLDADYGWMYDDGPGSSNLDCPHSRSPGCWGHRHGILDDFGTVGKLVMGAAVDSTGDSSRGDRGGTSMAATLAVTDGSPGPLVYTWVQALAATPRGAPAG